MPKVNIHIEINDAAALGLLIERCPHLFTGGVDLAAGPDHTPYVTQEAYQSAAPAPVIAAVLAPQPIQTPPPPPPPVRVPTAAGPTYALDQLAKAAVELRDMGKGEAVKGVLATMGANMMTELKPEQYGAFATALRQLGGKI